MTRILITGGAGFIGQHLVKRLLQCEGRQSVIVIDNLSRFHNKGFSKIVINKSSSSFGSAGSYVFYKVDLRNKKRIYDIIRRESIDLCIHLAALVSVPQSIKNPIETMDVNINGTLNLLEVCWQNKVRNFIFASSAAVYGKNSLMPLKEHLPLEPLSPYGVSKVAGEALVSLYKNSEKIRNTLSLRIFNVYGRGQNNSYAGVITKFANRLTRKLAPVIYGVGKQKRDFISARCCAVYDFGSKCSRKWQYGTQSSNSTNLLFSSGSAECWDRETSKYHQSCKKNDKNVRFGSQANIY